MALVSVAEVRAEGAPASVTDARITSRIAKWEGVVERLTRNRFAPWSPGKQDFDGTNSELVQFGSPLIAIVGIYINGDTVALGAGYYESSALQGGRGAQNYEEYRTNPFVRLTNQSASIFVSHAGRFLRGYRQQIEATWGCVQSDGLSAPQAVKDVLIALVCRDLDGYFDRYYGGKRPANAEAILSETTDDHSISYRAPQGDGGRWSVIPADLREVLAAYRAPAAMGAPENRVYSGDGSRVLSIQHG